MENKLSVAFLWHMHQPMYKDVLTGRYHLPWVRLHATYSYLDMASVVDDMPGVKCTFNLTPSLIWQLLDISQGGGADDKYLKLSRKPAKELTDADKRFILANFFWCDPKRAIASSERYAELFFRRGNACGKKKTAVKLDDFGANDFRDLQVLFNLAWCGFTLRKKDPIVRDLVRKGSGYTESDKLSLLKCQKKTVASIIPIYKRLRNEGKIEISTSPFYHPIVPLLYRNSSDGPSVFRKDAKVHLTKALSLYKKVFGSGPAGIWPPEGAVSREIIPLLSRAGIKWAASDEGILLESFGKESSCREDLIYNAFTASTGGEEIDMVFRDADISNAVSFKYSQMPAEEAAHELMDSIKNISKTVSAAGKSIVAVILDGENPWPYYADGGMRFLTEVYRKIISDKKTELVTIGEYLSSCGRKKKINGLFSGSWINRGFDKWRGSPQKNTAWKYLEKARDDLMTSGSGKAKAMEALCIAEGSDWFWWYDDFGSKLDLVFDKLFRRHLASIYTSIGKKTPAYLMRPVSGRQAVRSASGRSSVRGEMARPFRILLVSSECIPFAKTGGLADVTASLAAALKSHGCDVRIIMPFYKCVADGKFGLKKKIGRIKDPVVKDSPAFGLYTGRTSSGVPVYFVKNGAYFGREGLYGTSSGDYPDNGLRFAFFSRAVLAAAQAVRFQPDIIHCNDWQSALVPFYMKHALVGEDFFSRTKTLFTIHNMAYQGVFSSRIMSRIGMPKKFFDMDALEFYGKLNFMKSGILYSDKISTVSPRYAKEITTAGYGAGLEKILQKRKKQLHGILNGVDYSVWSPEKDPYIKARFTAGKIDKKLECKKDLLRRASLRISSEKPLIGLIARFDEQKGVDLFAGIIDRVIALGAGVVVLGVGARRYNKLFDAIARKYPGKVYVYNGFSEPLAHRIEAGCDMLVMPSRYEPCGLNQMYSIKYGTIPVVRATGGLDDVIVDFGRDRKKGNGFKFKPATSEALYRAIKRAILLYEDKKSWARLMKNAMKCDFSWGRSAGKYLRLYKELISEQ